MGLLPGLLALAYGVVHYRRKRNLRLKESSNETIFRIAQTELRLFFYSPIAWLILIIFAFQPEWHFVILLAINCRIRLWDGGRFLSRQ